MEEHKAHKGARWFNTEVEKEVSWLNPISRENNHFNGECVEGLWRRGQF